MVAVAESDRVIDRDSYEVVDGFIYLGMFVTCGNDVSCEIRGG